MEPLEIAASQLDPVVRALHGDSCSVREGRWQVRPLAHPVRNPVTGGLYHVTGQAECGDGVERTWAALLKVLHRVEDAPSWLLDDGQPSHWNYWQREVLAYRSGLIERLTDGLVAPRYLHSTRIDSNTWWLWIEYVEGVPGTRWPLGGYAKASYHLGRFQGTYLAGRQRLPDEDWLAQGWLQSWAPPCDAAKIGLLADSAARNHPLLRDHLPASWAVSLRRLCANRERLLALAESLPLTLCHHDFWPPNLFSRAASDDVTVAVDWSWVGPGSPGHDAANLVLDSIASGYIEAERAGALDTAVFGAYLQGLQEAGWTGPPASISAGYRIVAALRFGLEALDLLAVVRSEDQHIKLERRHGRPIGEIVRSRAAALRLALRHADALDEDLLRAD